MIELKNSIQDFEKKLNNLDMIFSKEIGSLRKAEK
jgi:hypothetical protein